MDITADRADPQRLRNSVLVRNDLNKVLFSGLNGGDALRARPVEALRSKGGRRLTRGIASGLTARST